MANQDISRIRMDKKELLQETIDPKMMTTRMDKEREITQIEILNKIHSRKEEFQKN